MVLLKDVASGSDFTSCIKIDKALSFFKIISVLWESDPVSLSFEARFDKM